MICQWNGVLAILPNWLRKDADKLGSSTLQELRLRLNKPPQLICQKQTYTLDRLVSREDLQYCFNTACRYSPWRGSTAASGYITAPGGHRLGLCGEAVIKEGRATGIGTVNTICIRVARDFPGIARYAPREGSLLILGRPGAGKTTLLRDLIRQRAKSGSVSVVDERQELFPLFEGNYCFDTGDATDVLSGCPKPQGIDMVLRTMGPKTIAVDEITACEDCDALKEAGWCGVDLLASAHAGSLQDFLTRPIYAPLVSARLFHQVLVLHTNQTWTLERMDI